MIIDVKPKDLGLPTEAYISVEEVHDVSISHVSRSLRRKQASVRSSRRGVPNRCCSLAGALPVLAGQAQAALTTTRSPLQMNPSPYHGSCSPSQPFDLNNVLAVCNEVWSCSLASPSLRGTSCS